MEWVKKGWAWFSHGATVIGLVPPGLVSLVIGVLAYLASQPAWVVILAVLGGFAAVSVLMRHAPKWIAITTIVVVLCGGSLLAARQHNSFRLNFQDVRIGLTPYDLRRSAASGGTVALLFENPNDFEIWVTSYRRFTSIDRMTSGSEQKVITQSVKPLSVFAITDEPIVFNSKLNQREIVGGTFDYYLCYGRSAEFDKKIYHSRWHVSR